MFKILLYTLILFFSATVVYSVAATDTSQFQVQVPTVPEHAFLCSSKHTFPSSNSVNYSAITSSYLRHSCVHLYKKNDSIPAALKTRIEQNLVAYTTPLNATTDILHLPHSTLHARFLEYSPIVIINAIKADASTNQTTNNSSRLSLNFRKHFRIEHSQLFPIALRTKLLEFVLHNNPEALMYRRHLLSPNLDAILQTDIESFPKQLAEVHLNFRTAKERFTYTRQLLKRKQILSLEALDPADFFRELYVDATLLPPVLLLTSQRISQLSAAWSLCVADHGKGTLTVYDDLSAEYRSSYATLDYFTSNTNVKKRPILVQISNSVIDWKTPLNIATFHSEYSRLSPFAIKYFSALWSLPKKSRERLRSKYTRFRQVDTVIKAAQLRHDLIYAAAVDPMLIAIYSKSCDENHCSLEDATTLLRGSLIRSTASLYANSSEMLHTLRQMPIMLPTELVLTRAPSCSTFGVFQAALSLLHNIKLTFEDEPNTHSSDFECIFGYSTKSAAAHTWSWSKSENAIYENGYVRLPKYGTSQSYIPGFRVSPEYITEYSIFSCTRQQQHLQCTHTLTKRPFALRQQHVAKKFKTLTTQIEAEISVRPEVSLLTGLQRRVY